MGTALCGLLENVRASFRAECVEMIKQNRLVANLVYELRLQTILLNSSETPSPVFALLNNHLRGEGPSLVNSIGNKNMS